MEILDQLIGTDKTGLCQMIMIIVSKSKLVCRRGKLPFSGDGLYAYFLLPVYCKSTLIRSLGIMF
jgi:hypothetical protein